MQVEDNLVAFLQPGKTDVARHVSECETLSQMTTFLAFRREAPSFVRLDSISFELPFQDLIFAKCLRDYY